MGTERGHNNFIDAESNPCIDEGKLSKKCLEENHYNPEKCYYYFENYKNCKKFWLTIKRLRMRHHIHPFLPGAEERQKILKEKDKGNHVFEVK